MLTSLKESDETSPDAAGRGRKRIEETLSVVGTSVKGTAPVRESPERQPIQY
jgi:hypothetical protein